VIANFNINNTYFYTKLNGLGRNETRLNISVSSCLSFLVRVTPEPLPCGLKVCEL